MKSLPLALVLAGCTASSSPGDKDGDGPGPDGDSGIEELNFDTGLWEDEVGDQPEDANWLWEIDHIGDVQLLLDDDALDNLWDDPYAYTEGGVVIDGIEVASVGVRLRGKYGSFRSLNGKPKFKIDFNRYVEGQRFFGLEALAFNNMVVDCSMMKEAVAAQAFAAMGVPSARVGYVRMTVNDRDYGLYLVVEVEDDRFLKRTYEDGSGNLYDGKYWWDYDDTYALLDFGDGVDELYELEEGTDVDHADIIAISEAYEATAGTPEYYEAMGELIDWDAWHRAWVGEQWTGHIDGYCLNTNNYRVYFDPEDGKADQVTWDHDYAFISAPEWGRSWANPPGNLAYWCLRDEACLEDWSTTLGDGLEVIDTLDLSTFVRDTWELIEEDLDDDPRKECSSWYAEAYRDDLYEWVDGRSDRLRNNWDLE